MNRLRRTLDEWTAMLARTYQQDLMTCKTIEEVNRIDYCYGPLLQVNPDLITHSVSAKKRIHAVEIEKLESFKNQVN